MVARAPEAMHPAVDEAAAPAPASVQVPGHEQLAEAKSAGRFFVGLFFDATSEPSKDALTAFDFAAAEAGTRATFTRIALDAPEHAQLREDLDLARTPLPAVVAVAPTGAVTRTLVSTWSEADLAKAFVGPGLQSMLRVLQDGKIAVLVVQPADASDREKANAGIAAFAVSQDEDYVKERECVALLRVDPRDPAERDLCTRFRIDPDANTTTTLVLAPPNKELGRVVGAITAARLLALTSRAKEP